jgi:hypothetical protein
VPAACAVLSLAVIAPALLGGGFVLVYDMVFTPRQPLLPASVGLGPALPRAVPADAVMALATTVLPGDLTQKLVLTGLLFAAALGAALLVPTTSTVIRVVAAVGYTWNAYVAERLFIGHWTLLLGYAALPWVVLAGLRLRLRRDGQGGPSVRKAAALLVLAMLPAVLGPTGGLLAAGAAIAAAGRQRLWITVPVSVVLNAPWWLPSVLHPAGGGSDPAGVAAFAARGESWGGPVLSVLGLGGIWNADVVPASRESPITPVITVLVVGLTLLGCLVLARRWGARPARALLVLAALGVLVGVAGAVPVLEDALRWSVAHVPGAGLARDGQRFAAWRALLVGVGFAAGVEEVSRRLADPLGRRAVLAGAVLLPLAVLPDLAWGGLGRLQPVHYPPDWAVVADRLAADRDRGDVLVLPLMTYRAFEWNDRRTQLDPAPRLLPATTITDDTLPVGEADPLPAGELLVSGEDGQVARVRRALAEGSPPLTELGIEWIVVEHGTPGELPPLLGELTPEHSGTWVSLYRVGDPAPVERAGPPVLPVLAADALALAGVLTALLWLLLPVGTVGADRSTEPAQNL